MKAFQTLAFGFALSCLLCLSGCREKDDDDTFPLALAPAGFPVLDGSNSTDPLRTLILCKTLGLDYSWGQWLITNNVWDIFPDLRKLSDADRIHLTTECLKRSNTHGSFMNLIDGKAELIITARGISRDEKEYADGLGVSLTEKPVAKDAFVFAVHADNPVQSLAIKQIQDIYTGRITNWSEVGGADRAIKPYVRNRNSGSQEKMETLVMAGLEMTPLLPELVIHTMLGPYSALESDPDGIFYTPYYYFDTMVRSDRVRMLAVNGRKPDRESITDGSYPYVTEVMAAVRSDIDKTSNAWKLFELLFTPAGQKIVKESGYVPSE